MGLGECYSSQQPEGRGLLLEDRYELLWKL